MNADDLMLVLFGFVLYPFVSRLWVKLWVMFNQKLDEWANVS